MINRCKDVLNCRASETGFVIQLPNNAAIVTQSSKINETVKNEVFKIDNSNITELQPYHTCRFNHSAIYYSGRIYVIGGISAKNTLHRSVESFDLDTLV